jgi:hypothetical protein
MEIATDMPQGFEALWADYQQRPRPENIGDHVSGLSLGELDDDVAAAASSYASMGEEVPGWHVARLGLALADLQRVLPADTPVSTREYVTLVAALATATLQAIVGQPTSRA